MSKIFLDTNVLIYTADSRDSHKQTRCRDVVRQLRSERRAVISTQVLQEFYVVAVKKVGVEPLRAKHMVLSFAAELQVVTVGPDLISDAIDTAILNSFSLWDSMMISAAVSANCGTLLTEDLHHGQRIRGVRIQNPFKGQIH